MAKPIGEKTTPNTAVTPVNNMPPSAARGAKIIDPSPVKNPSTDTAIADKPANTDGINPDKNPPPELLLSS